MIVINGLRKKMRTNTRGFTLTEVMVTLLILTIGILGLIAFITSGVRASDLAKDITVAMNHAEFVLEEMSTLATLNAITTTNWSNWVTTNGLNTLSNEAINVAFTGTDPLNIVVTVTWQTGLRSHSTSLTTEMTK